MASMKSVYVCGLLIIISSLSGPLNAADIITKTQFISDDKNEALLSSDGRFKLGFFSPGNSVRRYVGIWYRFSEKQVVWVADREIPVKNNSTGIFKIGEDGNLAVFDGTAKNDHLWSTNVSMETINSSAKLLPSENLVLVIKIESDSRETIIWQSFDYPTDSLTRKHRPLVETGLTLLAHANMPLKFWVEAFQTAAILINNLPSPQLRFL